MITKRLAPIGVDWAAAALLLPLFAAPAEATWSIVASDSLTQEVAIGSATCVTGIDLRALTPVLLVGVGGGAVQSLPDSSGQRRQIIRDGLEGGLTSQQIIDQLALLSGSDFSSERRYRHRRWRGDVQRRYNLRVLVGCNGIGGLDRLRYPRQHPHR